MYSWNVEGMFMEYLWNIYGIPMEYLGMYPRYLDDLWIYHVAFAILSNPPLPSEVLTCT